MRYSIETTENGVNETLEVDGNLYKNDFKLPRQYHDN